MQYPPGAARHGTQSSHGRRTLPAWEHDFACQPINMPGYAYERTCRRLAHRINSNTPCTHVTRNNVSLAGRSEWSNETVRNSVIVCVTTQNSSRNTIHLKNVLLSRLLTLNELFYVCITQIWSIRTCCE